MAIFDSAVEPMTAFDDHERDLLESALNNPRQKFAGLELYPTFVKKAAVLYYGMIKNHPFKNGNKRTATATLLVFIFVNNFWIKGEQHKVEDYFVALAQRVARSEGSGERDTFLNEIENWLSDHIVER